MTTKDVKKESEKADQVPEINFKCRFCQEVKPYSEMVVLAGFFPPITACRSCASNIENPVREEQCQEE
jgi:hypothetical protein